MLGIIAFSPKLKRPGCVLLQAVLGGDSALAQRFPAETWLVGGEPGFAIRDLRLFKVEDEAELERLIKLSEAAIQ